MADATMPTLEVELHKIFAELRKGDFTKIDWSKIIALLPMLLPLLTSLAAKNDYAAAHGFKGPHDILIEAAASYFKCCEGMAAEPPK